MVYLASVLCCPSWVTQANGFSLREPYICTMGTCYLVCFTGFSKKINWTFYREVPWELKLSKTHFGINAFTPLVLSVASRDHSFPIKQGKWGCFSPLGSQRLLLLSCGSGYPGPCPEPSGPLLLSSQMAPLDPFSWESVSKETASLCSQQLEIRFDPSLLAPICPMFIYLEI